VKKILITGGTGYIGGRLAQYLSQFSDISVTIGTRSTSLKIDNHISINWNDLSSLTIALKNTHTIVHLASMNDVECNLNPIAAYEVNLMNTIRLVEAAKLADVKRIIYFSTAHVYGAMTGHITEKTITQPISAYAASHRAAEDVILASSKKGIVPIVFRLANGFGFPLNPNIKIWHLFVNEVCLEAVTNHEIKLKGSGLQWRDFVTLHDIHRAVKHVLDLPANHLCDGLFNLGSGNSMQVIEMARLIQKRCFAKFGYSPKVLVPDLEGDISLPKLFFDNKKFIATGFKINGDVNNELDQLLEMCVEIKN